MAMSGSAVPKTTFKHVGLQLYGGVLNIVPGQYRSDVIKNHAFNMAVFIANHSM
jgi:hypothetical protein